jgi:hypothetical protein
MKLKPIIILLFVFKISYSQNLELCKYFRLSVDENYYASKKVKTAVFNIISSGNDDFSKFISKHANRYDYLLWNSYDSLSNYIKLFPDTTQIEFLFCKSLETNAKFNNFFKYITPKKYISETPPVITFTVDELMLAASRFFYCDRINEKDTTIQAHICVGINGQKEYKLDKDLTILEAFSFEAIFKFISRRKRPQFLSDYGLYIKNSLGKRKNNFKDFQILLKDVRIDCYDLMASNIDLKDRLLDYYKKNKKNLNFELK